MEDDFIAKLYYLTIEEGGRRTPAKNGYRPQVKFPFSEMQTSGSQTFIDKDIVYPGEWTEARIKIISVPFFAWKLNQGMKFQLREGNFIIATGEIIKILNPILQKK